VFIPGLRLAGEFYAEVVHPLLEEEFPALRYAAALLGPGSEVLGFDTGRSADHDWGPRLQVFLDDADADAGAGPQAASIAAMLDRRLPAVFRGYPVAFPVTREPDGAARHRVQVTGLGPWLSGQLGFDPRSGELSQARTTLAWYPDDVWLYVLSCQWVRISQEEAFPGRCAEVGDELGSAVVTARLARELMRLWLLMHRRYPPYSKWLGRAFARVPDTAALAASLAAALSATDWTSRERQLSQAYVTVAQAHNRLGLTEPLDPATRGFYDRPYQVLDAGRFAGALAAAITDPQLRGLPPIGAADQFIDSTDALGDLRCARAVISAF